MLFVGDGLIRLCPDRVMLTRVVVADVDPTVDDDKYVIQHCWINSILIKGSACVISVLITLSSVLSSARRHVKIPSLSPKRARSSASSVKVAPHFRVSLHRHLLN